MHILYISITLIMNITMNISMNTTYQFYGNSTGKYFYMTWTGCGLYVR